MTGLYAPTGQDANGYWNKSPWTTKTTLAGAPQQDAADGYVAQIVKTVDGGATWTSVFQENGTYGTDSTLLYLVSIVKNSISISISIFIFIFA